MFMRRLAGFAFAAFAGVDFMSCLVETHGRMRFSDHTGKAQRFPAAPADPWHPAWPYDSFGADTNRPLRRPL
jgi:hypothetical protein